LLEAAARFSSQSPLVRRTRTRFLYAEGTVNNPVFQIAMPRNLLAAWYIAESPWSLWRPWLHMVNRADW
jgi:hypothetical protein